MPLAAFQQNWLLWMTPEWGSKSDPKIGFADRASLGLYEESYVPKLTDSQKEELTISFTTDLRGCTAQ